MFPFELLSRWRPALLERLEDLLEKQKDDQIIFKINKSRTNLNRAYVRFRFEFID